MNAKKILTLLSELVIIISMIGVFPGNVAASPSADALPVLTPKFSKAVAFDVSPAIRDAAVTPAMMSALRMAADDEQREIRPDRGPEVKDQGFSGDGAIQDAGSLFSMARSFAPAAAPSPIVNFEGLSNQDNFNLFGFRVNPPDPDGDVGPNHYVEMINLVLGVYDKQGNLLLGPVPIGAIWEGFAVEDCTDPSGDPIVLYDQFSDRWLLSQFTTRDPFYYNCVAISQTGDPTGAYYRYAFPSGVFFPDYPKYGVWPGSYLLTSRDFGPTAADYGISVYALERSKMLVGDPNARAVQFFLDSNIIPIHLMGDGLLPPDVDGQRILGIDAPAPIVGTMDDGGPYGAPFDGLVIWE